MGWTGEEGGGDVCILSSRQDKAEVAVCSTVEVRVHRARVRLDFVPQFVDCLIRGFATDRSEVSSLEVSVMVVDRGFHGRSQVTNLLSYVDDRLIQVAKHD